VSPRASAQAARLARLGAWATITLAGYYLSACQREPRAREREAAEARAKAEAEAKAEARRAAEPPPPLPEEPPLELVRVPSSGLPCEVDDVFARKCRRCHTIPTRHGAPFVFLTWDDTQQDRGGQKLTQLIARAVRSNFMPYRIEANPPVAPLTDEEKKIILDWTDAGGPRKDCERNAALDQKSATVSPSANPKKPASNQASRPPATSPSGAR
jgi:hypothetical protein